MDQARLELRGGRNDLTQSRSDADGSNQHDFARPEASEGAAQLIAFAGPYLFWALVAVLLTGTWLM